MPRLQDVLISRLVELGVEHVSYPDRDDGFCGLRFNGREIAHFHSFNELDLRLTKKLILSEGLGHPPDSTVHPKRGAGSHWIELRFNRGNDLDEVVRVVQLAMAAY
jgi:hypothetical protein